MHAERDRYKLRQADRQNTEKKETQEKNMH